MITTLNDHWLIMSSQYEVTEGPFPKFGNVDASIPTLKIEKIIWTEMSDNLPKTMVPLKAVSSDFQCEM